MNNKIDFIKMHGLGNDFVIIDARDQRLEFPRNRVRYLADRKRGVGCDQLIIMERASAAEKADLFMRIYNPDGSKAGACGNATRCVADFYMRENTVERCTIETVSGVLACAREGESNVTVDMGAPGLDWRSIPLSEDCDTLHLPIEGDPVGVSMGNPHCVFFCKDALSVDIEKIGPSIERHSLFPDRTNVEFASLESPDHLRMRVWERGAGITQACGTGACAVAVAAIRRGMSGRWVTATLDGGDLSIEWRETDGHVLMTGPVAYVYEGAISFS